MRYFFGYFLAAAGGGIAFSSSASEITLKLSGSLPILLGVLLAAVFIRLARGFPAIPYERVSQSQAIRATSAFRMLVKSYIAAFSTFLLALMSNIFFHAVYSDTSKVAPFCYHMVPNIDKFKRPHFFVVDRQIGLQNFDDPSGSDRRGHFDESWLRCAGGRQECAKGPQEATYPCNNRYLKGLMMDQVRR